MTPNTYRVDYATDAAPNTPVVIECGPNRRLAEEKARAISKRPEVGVAYAIASRGRADIGQRVYSAGAFERQDAEF